MKRFVPVVLLFSILSPVKALAVDWVKTCEFPKTKDANAVLLGAEQGAVLSNIKMFSDHDRATLISVNVQRQETPIDLYLTSKTPLIWDVKAEPGGVEAIYVFSTFAKRNRDLPPAPRSSVKTDLSVPVLFIDAEKCDMPKRPFRSGTLTQRLDFLSSEIGRERSRRAEAEQPAVFDVSGGRIGVLNDYDRSLAGKPGSEELLKRFPGGYVELDLSELLGDPKNETLGLPPGLLGIYQLIDQGVFRTSTEDDVQAFYRALAKTVRMDDLDDFVLDAEFTVTESTELPFGLIEPLDFNLIVPSGVQVRGLWIGCLFGVKGPKFGGACREMNKNFAAIRKIASIDVADSCRVVTPGDGTLILAAQYDDTRPWMTRLQIPEETKAILVLDSTVKMDWLIEVPSSATIESVVRLGTDQQGLVGLTADTKVIDYVKSGVRPLSPAECYEVPVTSLRTSEFHFERENRFISHFLRTRIATIAQALTGQGVDLFLEPEGR